VLYVNIYIDMSHLQSKKEDRIPLIMPCVKIKLSEHINILHLLKKIGLMTYK